MTQDGVGDSETQRRIAHAPFTAVHNVEHNEIAGAVVSAHVIESGLPALHSANWATRATALDLPGDRVFVHANPWGRREIVRPEGALVDVGLFAGQATVTVAAETEDEARGLLQRLRDLLPAPDPSAAQEVTVTWEWREWCDIHYIVDPDSFFGQHADYLMYVLLQSEWESQFASWESGGGVGIGSFQIVKEVVATSEGGDEPAEGPIGRQKGWRLLVLEDTGELLQPDAKAIIGQRLSRFLNVVDGLIGQGLRVLVLVTTNEEIRKLHPAVARPGRSAANVRFDPLNAEEATAWLSTRGVDDAASPSATIAELYARLEGLGTPKQSVGFDDSPS